MSTKDDKEDYFQNLDGCQKKLLEINQRLIGLRKRRLNMKDINPKKYSKKKSAQIEENYNKLKKEAELLERDIAFVTSMTECKKGSLTSRLMKKVLPGRMFGRETSQEFQVSLMSHSTKFLEDKVKSLESFSIRPKKKKNDRISFSGDSNEPAISKDSIEIECDSNSSKVETNFIDSSIKNKVFVQRNVSAPKSEKTNLKYDSEHVDFNSDLCRRKSLFTLDYIIKNELKPGRKKQPSELKSAEKFSQTEADFPPTGSHAETDYLPKLYELQEKSIQTEEIKDPRVLYEISEALKKILEEYISSECVQPNIDQDEETEPFQFSGSTRAYENDVSTEQSKSFLPEISEKLLPSVCNWLQNRSLDIGKAGFFNYLNSVQSSTLSGKTGNSTNKFSMPFVEYKPKLQRNVKGQRCLQTYNYSLPEIYYIKVCISEYDFHIVPDLNCNDDFSNSAINRSISVQVIRKESKHDPMKSTLLIDYCHNSENSGRIVLEEFGNDQYLVQSEIFGRIVTYLLGLKTQSGKT